MHLALPLLFLLALRIDTRTAVLLSPLAILPDLDAFLGLHRAVLHSFIPVVIAPVALILYAKYRRPEWMLPALIVQFYLASHVVLDLGGVAFLWPVVQEQFYFIPEITFNLQGGINFGFELEYGMKPLEKMGTTSFLSEAGFALLFLGALVAVVFRKEAMAGLAAAWQAVRSLVRRRSRA